MINIKNKEIDLAYIPILKIVVFAVKSTTFISLTPFLGMTVRLMYYTKTCGAVLRQT